LVDRAVVLVDRIDCRSRQAAHGPHDPGRIARAIVEGLASSCESIGGANARRKPNHGGKALRSVAGVACESGQRTCRGKALRAGKSATVDAGAVEAVLAPRCCSAFRRESAGRDRERQRSGHQRRSRPKTLRRGGPLKRGPCPSHDNNVTRKVIEQAEACGAPSSVTQPGAGLPKGGPTPRSRRHSGLTPRTSCVEVVAAARAAGSGVERSSGARSERSVAEVGERHLPGVIEVSREGYQENAG